jgi:hypothetical protein
MTEKNIGKLRRQRAQMAYLTGRKVRKGAADGIKKLSPPQPLPWWWNLKHFKRFQHKHMT